MTTQKSVHLKIGNGCEYCLGSLPTVVITEKASISQRICRACILEALQAIEEPGEYPAIIERRDDALEIVRKVYE